MSKDGNINDSGSIQSGRKGDSPRKYVNNFDAIFRKKQEVKQAKLSTFDYEGKDLEQVIQECKRLELVNANLVEHISAIKVAMPLPFQY